MPKVLFVCTANICRSPYAEAALRAHLGADGLYDVSSAGVKAAWLETAGDGPCPEMPYGRVINAEGAPEGGSAIVHEQDHESEQLTLEMVREADIVIAFEQAHRAAIIDLLPRAQVKTYTARQVQRLARAVASTSWPDSAAEPTGDALRDLNAARSWAPYADDADVSDPHGYGVEAHHRCADEIEAIVADLAAVLRR